MNMQQIHKALRQALLLGLGVGGGHVATVMAENPCLKYAVSISGNFNDQSPISEVDSTVPHSTAEDLPLVEIPVPLEINQSTKSFALRFVRSDDSTWIVEGRSTALNESAAKSSEFRSPLATIRFGKRGRMEREEKLNAFVGYGVDAQRKAEFEITFTGMTESKSPNKLVVSPLVPSEQDCPNFGRLVLSPEDAKKPENRMRLFDPDGRDVTELGYDVTGNLKP